MQMKFDISKSFEDNIASFEAEVRAIDPECAAILFENLHILEAAGEAGASRAVIAKFNAAVLAALAELPPDDGKRA